MSKSKFLVLLHLQPSSQDRTKCYSSTSTHPCTWANDPEHISVTCFSYSKLAQSISKSMWLSILHVSQIHSLFSISTQWFQFSQTHNDFLTSLPKFLLAPLKSVFHPDTRVISFQNAVGGNVKQQCTSKCLTTSSPMRKALIYRFCQFPWCEVNKDGFNWPVWWHYRTESGRDVYSMLSWTLSPAYHCF